MAPGRIIPRGGAQSPPPSHMGDGIGRDWTFWWNSRTCRPRGEEEVRSDTGLLGQGEGPRVCAGDVRLGNLECVGVGDEHNALPLVRLLHLRHKLPHALNHLLHRLHPKLPVRGRDQVAWPHVVVVHEGGAVDLPEEALAQQRGVPDALAQARRELFVRLQALFKGEDVCDGVGRLLRSL
eukprot:scaffold4967_cov116-Isochrysis_galbana.AAC.4